MSASPALTLSKEERICSKTLIDQLFAGGKSRSMSAFPLRAVFMLADRRGDGVQDMMLISVPKKHFKRAVHRNRVKRQVREAFRKHKEILLRSLDAVGAADKVLVVAFIWQDDQLYDSATVEHKVNGLLVRIGEFVEKRFSADSIDAKEAL